MDAHSWEPVSMTDLAERQMQDGQSQPVDDIDEELGFHPTRMVMFFGFLAFLLLIGGWQLLVIVGAFVIFLLFHEFGHYRLAKWSGMLVTEYFIGFGPRIFSFKRGEVTYGLKAIPAGAYVRIVGMNNLEDVDPKDEARTYRQAAWHKRMLTIAAGPLSHFVVALLLGFGMFYAAGEPSEVDWEVGQVVPFGAAESIGVQEGDRIVSIGSDSTADFDELAAIVGANRNEEIDIVIARPNEAGTGDSTLGPDFDDLVFTTTLGEVLTDVGAGLVRTDDGKIFVDENGQTIDRIDGLYSGDMVLAVGDTPVTTYEDFYRLAKPLEGQTVEVEVVYNRERRREVVGINQLLAPGELAMPGVDDPDPTVEPVEPEGASRGFLGVGSERFREPRSLPDAASASAGAVWEMTSLISVEMPKRLATKAGVLGLVGISSETQVQPDTPHSEARPISVDENRLVSIIGAVRIARELANVGWLEVIAFLMLINISFGILNALPMLPLDGGHMVIATYERIRSFGGKTYHADAAKLLPVTYAVVVLFMLIGGIAMVRDVVDPIVLPN